MMIVVYANASIRNNLTGAKQQAEARAGTVVAELWLLFYISILVSFQRQQAILMAILSDGPKAGPSPLLPDYLVQTIILVVSHCCLGGVRGFRLRLLPVGAGLKTAGGRTLARMHPNILRCDWCCYDAGPDNSFSVANTNAG